MITYNDPRLVVSDILRTNLIGPSNELFDTPPNEEIITSKPLNKYYSAILFPTIDGEKCELAIAFDEDDIDAIVSSDESSENDSIEMSEVLEYEEARDDDTGISELYPRSMGLTFCLKPDATCFSCHTTFGTYEAISPTDKSYKKYSLQLSLDDFQKIQNFASNTGDYDVRLTELFQYDSDTSTVSLKRQLIGNMAGNRTGDFKALDSIWNILLQRAKEGDADTKTAYKEKIEIYSKLMSLTKSAWIRRDHSYVNDVLLSELVPLRNHTIQLVEGGSKIGKGLFSITLDIEVVKQHQDFILVRVVLVNSSRAKLPMYIQNNELMNTLAIFQCSLQITCSHLIPLPSITTRSNQTQEDRVLDCQYRRCPPYGQAHNCSLEKVFIDNEVSLRSTFLPRVKPVVMVSNTSNININDVLIVHRNSVFTKLENQAIIDGLQTICDEYSRWIDEQETEKATLETYYTNTAENIIHQQREALARMHNGVELIRNNQEILDCYKLTNASMLVNMLTLTVSHDLRQNQSFYCSSEFVNVRYHLFQLAFLLLNIESIVMPESRSRKELVDILWFPTGGGKTEAYLLLAAFTLIWRRQKYGISGQGTAVIMRYTLRLLTSQQFERASKIILAMNCVCGMYAPDLVSDAPFSIGLWIGGQSSPNKLKGVGSAEECISSILDKSDMELGKRDNKFPIDTCPWCGSSLISKNSRGQTITGYRVMKDSFRISCLDPGCLFQKSLPIDCIDESLYMSPPSLLFATIDKLAQLAWKKETRAFFGGTNDFHPPELIIQDELHLISGPLGTISGLFENVVELVCSKSGKTPKIIASTATIKNASAQVDMLYGCRKAFSFPPPGLDFNDNFFSYASKDEPNREYIGVYPTGKTFVTTQIRLLSLLLYSRWKLFDLGISGIDNYWSLVSYHNSLRELGRIVNKTGDEISHSYKSLINKYFPEKLLRGRLNYPKELTGRISGYAIKSTLASLSRQNIDPENLDDTIGHTIDLVYATNMISVGLDIDRFNLMLVNGQPRSISEYIQVTSRIARKYPGLVISAFNPVRIRDKSHFEAFEQFHESYYRFIEPVSITPFTKAVIDRMSATVLSAYLRVKLGIEDVKDINIKTIDGLYSFFMDRIRDKEMYDYFVETIQRHIEFAAKMLSYEPAATIGKDLLKKPQQIDENNYVEGMWIAMESMRDVGANAVLKVQIPKRRMHE